MATARTIRTTGGAPAGRAGAAQPGAPDDPTSLTGISCWKYSPSPAPSSRALLRKSKFPKNGRLADHFQIFTDPCLSFLLRQCARFHRVAENALVALHRQLDIVAHVVACDLLPCDEPQFRNGLNMLVSLGMTSYRNHCCFMGWNDHLRIGLLAQNSFRYRIAVVGTIRQERVERRGDLVEQIGKRRWSRQLPA